MNPISLTKDSPPFVLVDLLFHQPAVGWVLEDDFCVDPAVVEPCSRSRSEVAKYTSRFANFISSPSTLDSWSEAMVVIIGVASCAIRKP